MDTFLIAGIILLVGIVLFIYFSTRRNYRLGQPKAEPIEHYEEKRDEASDQEAEVEEKEEPEENSSGTSIGNLYQVVVMIVVIVITLGVGTAILNEFTKASPSSMYNTTNISQVAESMTTIASFMPLIVTIAVLATILKMLVSTFGSTEEKPKKRRKKRKMNAHINHYSSKRDEYSDAEAGIKNQKETPEEETEEGDEEE